jgi:hypothetical protein
MIANIVILLIMISTIGICFVSSYQLKRGKWLMLIAGYNDLPKEEREKIDAKGLGRDVSKVLNLAAVFLIIETIAIIFPLNHWVKNKVFGVCMIVIPLLIFTLYTISMLIKNTKKRNKL